MCRLQGENKPTLPLVEFLSAILTFLCINEFGWTLHGASAVLLSYVLISLAFIDYESGLLPDSITIPFIWVGLTLNYFDTITSFEKLLGSLVRLSYFVGCLSGVQTPYKKKRVWDLEISKC